VLKASRRVDLPFEEWRQSLQVKADKLGWPVKVTGRTVIGDGQMLLSAKVLTLEVRTQSNTQQVKKSIEKTEGRQPNPAWQTLNLAVDEADRKVVEASATATEATTLWQEAQTKLSDFPGSARAMEMEEAARQEHNNAQAELKEATETLVTARASRDTEPTHLGTPQTIEASYQLTETTLTEVLALEGRCTILGDSQVEIPISTNVDREVTDTSHDAVPTIGLNVDPMTLPAEEEARQKLQNLAMTTVLDAAYSCREAYMEDAWEQARRLKEKGWTEAASEAFVRAWLMEPSRGTDEVVDYLVVEAGAPEESLRALMSTTDKQP